MTRITATLRLGVYQVETAQQIIRMVSIAEYYLSE